MRIFLQILKIFMKPANPVAGNPAHFRKFLYVEIQLRK